jgi:hypothetical protein
MYDDRDEYLEYVARDEAEQAKWEEEAHYWHTVMALVDLIEEHGHDAVMADVVNTLTQRALEATPEPLLADIVPMPDLSFMSIRTGVSP